MIRYQILQRYRKHSDKFWKTGPEFIASDDQAAARRARGLKRTTGFPTKLQKIETTEIEL